MNNYCPVQASVDRYLADCDAADALDNAIDDRKEELMKTLTPEIVSEALCEVPDSDVLWKDIMRGVTCVNSSGRVYLENADDIVRGLFSAVESYVEKEAERQIKHERDNPPPSQRDYDDDH